MIAAHGLRGLAHVGGDLSPCNHGRAALGERGLLAVPGRKSSSTRRSMPQDIGLARWRAPSLRDARRAR